jgi:hypothetical protein
MSSAQKVRKWAMAATVAAGLHGVAVWSHGQLVSVTNQARQLSPEDFAPFVFEPRVLLDATSSEGLNRTWQPFRHASDWFLTIDPLGRTVVPCVKGRPYSGLIPQLVRLDSSGQLIDVSPTRYAVPLATGQINTAGDPVVSMVSYDTEVHYPLVRDEQGGKCRLLGTGPGSSDPFALMAVREVGERVTVLNTTGGLARHYGFGSLRFSVTSGPSELLRGIRHFNGAWAVPFSATSPNTSGLLLNLDVPVGQVAADGRTLAMIRNTDRIWDANAWMEVGEAGFSVGDYRFASTQLAVFRAESFRYTTPSRPTNPSRVRAYWTSNPAGQVSLAARVLTTDETPHSGMPTFVFRSLGIRTPAINAGGDLAFVSAGGMAREPEARAGLFTRTQAGMQRLLSLGDWVLPGPSQQSILPLPITRLPSFQQPQISNRGDVLATVGIGDQEGNSLIMRLAAPDRQADLSGWVRIAGPGDRLTNSPRWRVVSIAGAGANTSDSARPLASLNNQGQVLVLATIENPQGQRTAAYLGFDLQSGLHLLFANYQTISNPMGPVVDEFVFTRDTGELGWHTTNSGLAERFNDAGHVAVHARRELIGRVTGVDANAALLFTLKRACNRADLSGDLVPMVSDGVLDNHDAAAFVELFFQASPRADVTEDGSVDGADITRFIELMTTACE